MNDRMNNRRGMALLTALYLTFILVAFSGGLVLKTIQEIKLSDVNVKHNQALSAAFGGARAALDELDTLINNYLLNTISNSSPSGVTTYAQSKVSSGDGIGWLVYVVRDNNVPVLTQNGEQAEFSGSGVLGNAAYQYQIVMTEKSDPVTVTTDVWDFPYYYEIIVTASVSGMSTNIYANGDFTVRVQKDNFAKYALFTNSQSTPSGSQVWFTDFTNFAGPVHTNDRFNFARNPSGTFEESVQQYQTKARFYNNGSSILLNADYNGTKDVPVFHDGFTRGVSQIALSSATQEADMSKQARGNQTFASNGIYVPYSGSNLAGGIYVKGNASIAMSTLGNDKSVYTVTQGSTTKTITVDISMNETTVDDGSGSQTYTGLPDGIDNAGTVIYVEGQVDSFSGTVQKDTQMTVASKYDMKITENVLYTNYDAAVGSPGDAGYVPPNATGEENLLGIVSWQGDVRITTAAPDDVQVHASILAMNGIFQVDSYDSTGIGPRGTATLLGGVIQDNYGAFGTFSGSTGAQLSGYGRNFVYDSRMGQGYAPPYFPSLSTFIAFTNDITDKIIWQEGQ